MTLTPGDGSGQHRPDEIVEFGRGRGAGHRWRSRALLACLVVATGATIAIRAAGHQDRPAAKAAPPAPPVRVTAVGHRLLGITAGWELFARGPHDLLRIQFAPGRITQTYVPPLMTGNPDVTFLVDSREAVIRSTDMVPGYAVPDGGQARPLASSLVGGGPLVPGPAGAQAAWVTSGSPTTPTLSLVTLTGHRAGQSIRFPPGGPQLPATAVSDGRGDVLLISENFTVYDAGPGWDRPVPGMVVAVGPSRWLAVTCDAQYRHCRNQVIDAADGSRRVLPGSAAAEPYYFSWPPTGVIAPDGAAAAVAESGRGRELTVHLIDLRTGAIRDLGVPLGVVGGDLGVGTDSNEHAMAWSPDSRWLFVAAAGGRLVAVNAQSGRAESLGVTLPAVDQVATRAGT
ncbi:MAG TPA: hypothetical protein VMF87_08240 [Streptosporangiaceae bacterium]|nr:hypothetical protein [Streptosporangiaceae bacterium]